MFLCAAGTLAVPTAAYAGTTSVAAAIKAQDKIVKDNPAYKAVQDFQADGKAQDRALIAKLAKVEGSLTHAVTVVSGASPTSSAQKQGQQDWVAGTRRDISGVSDLKTGFSDLLVGKSKATIKAELTKGVKALKAGNLEEAKGDNLLGLPTTD